MFRMMAVPLAVMNDHFAEHRRSPLVFVGAELRLTDAKGRLVIIPSNVLAYVEIGAEGPRPVGFGAL